MCDTSSQFLELCQTTDPTDRNESTNSIQDYNAFYSRISDSRLKCIDICAVMGDRRRECLSGYQNGLNLMDRIDRIVFFQIDHIESCTEVLPLFTTIFRTALETTCCHFHGIEITVSFCEYFLVEHKIDAKIDFFCS